jgi:stress-induced morphogen
MAHATVSKRTPKYVTTSAAAIKRRLPGSQIQHEQVRQDRYRLIVVSTAFEEMGHPERQRLVWDIADDVLDKPDLLKVSMILTVSESEVPAE